MIAMTKTKTISGEQHYALEIDEEGAAYVADVLEKHEFYDAGAMAVVRAIRSALEI